MAAPDELLAEARQAAADWIAAVSDSPEEWDAADMLVSRFRALDEHMKATGQPPAEWAPLVNGWEAVIPCPDQTTADQVCAQIVDRYDWSCAVRQRDDEWLVATRWAIRQNAEIALRRVREDLGYRGGMMTTCWRPASPEETRR
jgi:hypothetical protein